MMRAVVLLCVAAALALRPEHSLEEGKDTMAKIHKHEMEESEDSHENLHSGDVSSKQLFVFNTGHMFCFWKRCQSLKLWRPLQHETLSPNITEIL